MAGDKYLYNNAGQVTEKAAVQSSAGAGDAGKIPALDSGGHLDATMMPTGIAADTAVVTTSEALSAGDLVNIWNSSGAKARKADGSSVGKEAHGFVKSAFGSGAAATVYFEGTNDQVSGLTPGVQFLSAATPGAATNAAPSGAGNVVQRVGFATSATSLNFESNLPIALA